MDVTQPSDTTDPPAAFATEAAKFREALSAGRSAVFLQLFNFLVERSSDERSPKEVEIAFGVFGKNGSDGALADSAVRVYVHRLRKRLDDFYSGSTGPRLHIPKGEYRIVLSPGSLAPDPAKRSGWYHVAGQGGRFYGWVALTVLLVGNLLAWFLLAPQLQIEEQTRQLHGTGFWRPMSLNTPTMVVIGDSFVLAEADKQNDIKRLILEPAIRSRGDFGSYLTTHPSAFYTLYDLNLHYAPIGTAVAAWNLLPTIAMLDRGKQSQASLISSSRLKAQSLGTGDVVYVGRLAHLGILSSPLFRASRFHFGQTQDELIDQPSGRRYKADAAVAKEQQLGLDYGYIASLPGPSGKHIFIVSGVGDSGVQSMAALVTDPARISWLARQWGKKNAFEALYEVRTMGDVILDRSLVVARPLRTGHIWDERQTTN